VRAARRLAELLAHGTCTLSARLPQTSLAARVKRAYDTIAAGRDATGLQDALASSEATAKAAEGAVVMVSPSVGALLYRSRVACGVLPDDAHIPSVIAPAAPFLEKRQADAVARNAKALAAITQARGGARDGRRLVVRVTLAGLEPTPRFDLEVPADMTLRQLADQVLVPAFGWRPNAKLWAFRVRRGAGAADELIRGAVGETGVLGNVDLAPLCFGSRRCLLRGPRGSHAHAHVVRRGDVQRDNSPGRGPPPSPWRRA